MKELIYKISRKGRDGKLVEQEEVKGFLAFELYGYQWGAHEEIIEHGEACFNAWEISETSTGFGIEFSSPAFSLDEAVQRAEKYLINKGEIIVRHHVEKAKEFLTQSV